jgi:hypothetical protein
MTALSKDRLTHGIAHAGIGHPFEASLEAALRGDSIALAPEDKKADELLRVLIVDDHRASADTLFRLAEIWGHEGGEPTTGLRVWH